MNKLCCCADAELPDVTVKITCPCCESHMEDREEDETDSPNDQCKPVREKQKEQEEETTRCCCFRRKRHAKLKKKT